MALPHLHLHSEICFLLKNQQTMIRIAQLTGELGVKG
jgi:hypothetical protein